MHLTDEVVAGSLVDELVLVDTSLAGRHKLGGVGAGAFVVDQSVDDPWIEHHKLNGQVVGDVWNPASLLVLLDVQLVVGSVVAGVQRFGVLTDSVVLDIADSEDTAFFEAPPDKVVYKHFVVHILQGEELIAEKIQTSRKDGSGVVEPLHRSHQRDIASDPLRALGNFRAGVGGGLPPRQREQLMIDEVDQLEGGSTVGYLPVRQTVGQEGMHFRQLRRHYGSRHTNIVEVVLELTAHLIKLQPETVKELAEGPAGIDIGQHNHTATAIEEADDVGDAQVVGLYLSGAVPFWEVHISTMRSQMYSSQYFSLMSLSKVQAKVTSPAFSSLEKKVLCVCRRLRLSSTTSVLVLLRVRAS